MPESKRLMKLRAKEEKAYKAIIAVQMEIQQCLRDEAPKCEKCSKKLWPSFIVVEEKDGKVHDFCIECAYIFEKSFPDKVKGAWDVPDPMGG